MRHEIIYKLISKFYQHSQALEMLRKKRNLKIIDLGCGSRKIEGSIGVDIVKVPGVDVVWDLRKKQYPFKSSSADIIHCSQVMEHLAVKEQIVLLEECWRILKKAGLLDLRVPHAFSIAAFQDPDHKAFFTFHSIEHFLSLSSYKWHLKPKIKFRLIKRSSSIVLTYSRNQNTYIMIFNILFTLFLRLVLNLSPGLADLCVKIFPLYFVDIILILKKI